MDAYEATKIVFQRIQACDPENASKIMGILLIHDHGEKEMIRLALGPEASVHSVIHKARKELSLSSPSTPSTPSPPSPFSNPMSLSRQNSCSSVSSRLLGGVNINLPSPLSITKQSSAAASSWSNSSFSDFQASDDLVTASFYSGSSPSDMNSSAAAPFHANRGEVDLIDELQLQAQLSFLNDGQRSLGPKNPDFFYHQQQDLASSPSGDDALLFPSYASNCGVSATVNGLPHRRSFSVSDICMGPSDDLSGGYGWRPCLYYARGYCKNGTSCRFLHGEGGGSLLDAEGGAMVGSPSNFEIMEHCQELLRSKSIQHQRMVTASQFMASNNNYSYSTFPTSKCMNFLPQQQLASDSPRTQMLSDGTHKFIRGRFERNEFSLMGGSGMASPGSRQIYLTFPADSTFKEEDVSNYFSIFGPVQDVRIPYQPKRMFGFVTFEYSETVKLILAKGNPHFVCDARVLVKPYKEKGKIPDKYSFCRKQQQHMDKLEFTAGLESRDPFDLDLGARMFYNSQEMLLRRKLEKQADLQQAIDLQNRRLMGLQLLEVEKNGHIRSPSAGSVTPSPMYSTSFFNQNMVLQSNHSGSMESQEEICLNNSASAIQIDAGNGRGIRPVNVVETDKCSSLKFENGKESSPEKSDSEKCVEHNLPDSPFASPKAVNDYDTTTTFSHILLDSKNGGLVPAPPSPNSKNSVSGSSIYPANSSLDMGPFKSCYFHIPRFASSHEAIGM